VSEPLETIRARLVPALLTGLGAIILAAGLLSYTSPVTASVPSATPDASVDASPSAPFLSLPPDSPDVSPSASPGASASPASRVATRVVIPALRIDLPIVKPPTSNGGYPYCNVAMYLTQLHQPGEPGATYIFAHARTGMFLPLLDQSKINNGAALKGMLVQVYTSDDQLFLYSISDVFRHVLTPDDAIAETRQVLYLQTSEGPHGTPQKLQVVALPLSSGPADHADAHPTPHPVVCGP
jgi:hypothetical protein